VKGAEQSAVSKERQVSNAKQFAHGASGRHRARSDTSSARPAKGLDTERSVFSAGSSADGTEQSGFDARRPARRMKRVGFNAGRKVKGAEQSVVGKERQVSNAE